MPESLTARVRERPEPRTGGALGAALFSALMFGSFVRLPLLLPFALLAPFPLLVVRLLQDGAGRPGHVVRGGAGWPRSSGAGPGSSISCSSRRCSDRESMARGRDAAWVRVGLRRPRSPGQHVPSLRERRHAGDRAGLLRALALAGVPGGLRASMPPEQVDAFVEQAATAYEAMLVSIPPPTSSWRPSSCSSTPPAEALPAPARPGWLDAGEFEGVRWPFVLAVALEAPGPGDALGRPPAAHDPLDGRLAEPEVGTAHREPPARAWPPPRSCGRRCWCWC